ncbi:NAD-dependent epimerase/dehydratase family protein [Streptomyces viridosporus]|uniref:NAD-dependent epimerase/dehydratase family protein n=1 Tax=Streptomyces viridosporus TaxID=67581 RepID=UPI0009BD5545|nr:NAD(P)-dependent oxidoreductase [Streptomyces viridosporus]
MRPLRVVLTGATGFIGSAVLRALAGHRGPEAAGEGRRLLVRAVGRRRPEGAGPDDEWARADLARPRTLRGVCEDADVLLHMAAAIGPDESECAAVNVDGTAALMREAARAGVSRIVHLSTAAVYGPGPHRGTGVDEVAPAPVSPASRTRLAGETYALAAGATVLRPGLVLGRGDRWVVPLLAQCLRAVPAMWDGGRGRVSVVAVNDLARLVARLGVVPGAGCGRGIWHASHPRPVRVGELLRTLSRHDVLPSVTADLPWEECLQRLRAARIPVSERQFALVATDHWYRSSEVWHVAGCAVEPSPLTWVDDAAPWYRSVVAARSGG